MQKRVRAPPKNIAKKYISASITEAQTTFNRSKSAFKPAAMIPGKRVHCTIRSTDEGWLNAQHHHHHTTNTYCAFSTDIFQLVFFVICYSDYR